MTTTTARPPEFDARLMAYYSHLKRRAYKLTNNKSEQEELPQDTIAYILGHWESFRPDGGFYNWIILCMRHVAQNKRRREEVRSRYAPTTNDERAMLSHPVPADQEDYADLSRTLADMNSRNGGALLRRAMGDTLDEIGARLGVGRERARQITEKERARLRAAA
ncbi:sigma-70 family RNA polymerase sigma factor [Rhizobium leucaenae]|uniref:sigma-70 family RNA polymerase sigma factor n=1 Tax=Rhizobium leucaenae TaxID=29450 RepID=UPI0007EE54F5|nr:sigma-70 family RNA polymerase sigma factor [Rhizobium leucaenae]